MSAIQTGPLRFSTPGLVGAPAVRQANTSTKCYCCHGSVVDRLPSAEGAAKRAAGAARASEAAKRNRRIR